LAISRERAERIARAHACERCGEYSYKKVLVKPADAAEKSELGVSWHVLLICGVCGRHHEIGIDDEGEIVYVS
jgi:transcription elongation factor Elf1